MTADITLLVNPVSGRGRGARAAEPAAGALRAAGLGVHTVVGVDATDALEQARKAVDTGTAAVVAVGGDGMVSLALQAVAGTNTPLGVVAAGTGNDFARVAGLRLKDPAGAAGDIADALAEGRTRAVDLGRIGERWFGTVAATGFDSRVNDRGNRMRWPRGRFRYDVAMLAELAALRPVRYRMRLDDGPEQELDATLIAVGNGPSYGGGMRMCAGAETDDGLFDICVVGPTTRRTLLRVFPKVYKGAHVHHPVVTVHRAARVRLAADDVTAYADGERVGPLPLTARTVPGALRLLA